MGTIFPFDMIFSQSTSEKSIPYSKRIWPTAVADEVDMKLTLSASGCHIDGQNSVSLWLFFLSFFAKLEAS